MMVTFEALVTRPYWSTAICATFADEPYVPAVTPLVGKTPVERVPNERLEAFRLLRVFPESPEILET